MRISIDALPALPPLFLDYIRGAGDARRFLPAAPDLDAVEAFAREQVLLEADDDDTRARARLVKVLGDQQARWTDAPGPLGRFGDGAVAVVTGQQAGLFTGSLLSVFKALTAIKLAREIERRGVPAVPVFWIASDDHDAQEISSTGIVDGRSMFRRVSIDFEGSGARPVAWLRYGGDVSGAIEDCFSSLPPSEWHDEVRGLVASAYRPGVSPTDAFATMMLTLFRGTGLVMVDPMDPAFREISSEALDLGFRERGRVRAAVLGRTREIRESGYPEQVRVEESFTGLFVLNNGSRRALDPASADGSVPSELSPNVLLRPFVQDSVLPTSAYVAGPAEVAYFAQAAAVYETLGRPLPPVWPRITATLIEPPVSRIMKKHDLRIEDVFAGPRHLQEKILGQSGDGERFDEVSRGVMARLEELRPLLRNTDETLAGALDKTAGKVERQLQTLRSRFVSARTRRDDVLEGHLRSLSDRLFPEETLQERALNVTSFMVRYGTRLTAWLDEQLELDGSVHQVVEL